jgi:hypothetical protein
MIHLRETFGGRLSLSQNWRGEETPVRTKSTVGREYLMATKFQLCKTNSRQLLYN